MLLRSHWAIKSVPFTIILPIFTTQKMLLYIYVETYSCKRNRNVEKIEPEGHAHKYRDRGRKTAFEFTKDV